MRPLQLCITLFTIFLRGGSAETEYRTYDGTNNNLQNPNWGSAGSKLIRYSGQNFYADGISAIRTDLPNPRAISNLVFGLADQPDSTRGLTDLTTYWGQFIDHDMSHTPHQVNAEPAPIPVPSCDPAMDSGCTGTSFIPFTRSVYSPSSGTDTNNPREQINDITSFLDGSMVYGSDTFRIGALRVNSKMWVIASNTLPPFNTANLTMENEVNYASQTELFAFGDVRGNENVGLLSLQTLFLREHNRWAGIIRTANPNYTDEQVFQEARRRVIAVIQAITVNEYIPVTLGKPLPPYTGYKADVNPTIMTEFSSGAFRYGHSEVNSDFLRLDVNYAQANTPLRVLSTYYNPSVMTSPGAVDEVIRGMAFQTQKKVDTHLVEDLRNYLFSKGGLPNIGMDLVAINIQRGRDHGIPSFTQTRAMFNLPAYTSFNNVTSNVTIANALSQAYGGKLQDCDLYVCGLAEDNAPNANVGPTFAAVIEEQYIRLRDGDRFWYENNQFNGTELQEISSSTLAEVIMRNTGTTYIQCGAFTVPDGSCWLGDPPTATGTNAQPPPPNTFVITVALKQPNHPFYEQGSNTAFVINGVPAANLTLVRGQTYTFINRASSEHQFFLSRTASGYNLGLTTCYNGAYTTGCPTDYQETMTFTPPMNDSMYAGGLVTPNRLSYACTQHAGMGGPIYLVNTLPSGTTYSITSSSATSSSASMMSCSTSVPVSSTSTSSGSSSSSTSDSTTSTSTSSGRPSSSSSSGIVEDVSTGTSIAACMALIILACFL